MVSHAICLVVRASVKQRQTNVVAGITPIYTRLRHCFESIKLRARMEIEMFGILCARDKRRIQMAMPSGRERQKKKRDSNART